jgi:hypothetical protein
MKITFTVELDQGDGVRTTNSGQHVESGVSRTVKVYPGNPLEWGGAIRRTADQLAEATIAALHALSDADRVKE